MKAKDLRKKQRKNELKQPCYICGRHQTITELHHVFTLKDCANVIETVKSVDVPLVWLCPNCHTYIHQMYNGKFYNAMREMSEDEYLKMCELMKCREDVFAKVIEEANI